MRRLALIAAGVGVVLVFSPPIWGEARHYLYVETIQFCLAAFAVPALVVVSRPLGPGGIVSRGRDGVPWRWVERARAGLGRLGHARLRHPELIRALGFTAADLAVVVAWRTPPAVDELVRHEWLVVPEVLSLLVAGLGLWLEVLDCPPLVPRVARPWRALVAALAMWATWAVGYALGFSESGLYRAYHYAAGGLGAVADQQVASGLFLLAGICAFAPVVFADLIAWLQGAEDPDAELRQLVRAERRTGWRPPSGG